MSKQKGYWIDDPFKSFISGHTLLISATRDAMQLSKEVEDFQNFTFPVFSEEFDSRYSVEHPDKEIVTQLGHFLLSETRNNRWRSREGKSFQNLSELFSGITSDLVTLGKTFYVLDWEKPNPKSQMILPSGLRRLSPATVSIKRNWLREIIGFHQSYSLFADIETGEPKRFDFTERDVLYLEYPFGHPPVKESLGLVRSSKRFWSFGTDRIEADNNPDDHHYKFESSRTRAMSDEKRKYEIDRTKIRRIFGLPLTGDIRITEQYEAYLITDFAKRICRFQQYIISEFNEQVLRQIPSRNKVKVSPKLVLKGPTEASIDKMYQRHKTAKEPPSQLVKNLRAVRAL